MAETKNDFIQINLESGEFWGLPTLKYTQRKPYTPQNSKHVLSIIPGIIRNVYIQEGQLVTEGDTLLELEAMKMFNRILAPRSGKIKHVYVKSGDKIPKNFLMIEYF